MPIYFRNSVLLLKSSKKGGIGPFWPLKSSKKGGIGPFWPYVCRGPKRLGPLTRVELDFFRPSATNWLEFGFARSTF